MQKTTYTLTFGDIAENHVGMQRIGNVSESGGFSLEMLENARNWFESRGIECELVDLNRTLDVEAEKAYLLIARGGLDVLGDCEGVFEEQRALPKDTKAKMRGRVVNKRARHNLCFGEESQEADFEAGKGTVVAFKQVPLLNEVRLKLENLMGCDLVVEGNYYYDTDKCYIGFHGDAERHKVIGVRLGAPFPLYYQWHLGKDRIGSRIDLMLSHGDVYIMSEKAVGHDWRKRKIYTLRHAAGPLNKVI